MFGQLWTPAEDAKLRTAYLRGGIKAAASALPHRTPGTIYHRASRLKLGLRKRWTQQDDARLELLWGLESVRVIAETLERKPVAVYVRARILGLPLGCPCGYEYLTDACKRTGYKSSQLRTILRFGGVKLHKAWTSTPHKRKRATHVVVPEEVDEACAAWSQTEIVEQAAARRGMLGETLTKRLKAAGVKLWRASNAPHANRRATTEEIEHAIREWDAKRVGRVSVHAEAKRRGIHNQTLRGWLERAGVPRGYGRFWFVDPEVLERVVREAAARPESRAMLVPRPVAMRALTKQSLAAFEAIARGQSVESVDGHTILALKRRGLVVEAGGGLAVPEDVREAWAEWKEAKERRV